MNLLTDNVVVEIIRSLIGPATLIFLGYFTWSLQQTKKQVTSAAQATQEVKKEVRNSHPMSLRADLDQRFNRIDQRFDKQDTRLENIEDTQAIQEIQVNSMITVLQATKDALDEGFKSDS